MNDIFGREPVLILGAIQAGIAVAVGFGLHWSGEQVALVTFFAAAILSVLARSKVSPV